MYVVYLNCKKISKNHQTLLEIKKRSMDKPEKRKIQSTRETVKESVRLKQVDHSVLLKLISAHFAYSYRYTSAGYPDLEIKRRKRGGGGGGGGGGCPRNFGGSKNKGGWAPPLNPLLHPILFPHYTCFLIVRVYGTGVIDMIRKS